MKKSILLAMAGGVLFASSALNAAEQYGSAKEAEALVAKAVKHLKTVGKTQALSDFTEKKNGEWVDRDLYVAVTGFDGTTLAHSFNAKIVGKNLMDMRDAGGKEFMRELVATAKSKDKFWYDYQWSDPVTKKILPKSLYCERAEETAVCVGIYKR